MRERFQSIKYFRSTFENWSPEEGGGMKDGEILHCIGANGGAPSQVAQQWSLNWQYYCQLDFCCDHHPYSRETRYREIFLFIFSQKKIHQNSIGHTIQKICNILWSPRGSRDTDRMKKCEWLTNWQGLKGSLQNWFLEKMTKAQVFVEIFQNQICLGKWPEMWWNTQYKNGGAISYQFMRVLDLPIRCPNQKNKIFMKKYYV